MLFTNSPVLLATTAVFAILAQISSATPVAAGNLQAVIQEKRAVGYSFNFDFENNDTGDVGTVKWDLPSFPIRHPFVNEKLPPGVNAKVTALARDAYSASVTGEGIYCEIFQNENCQRTKEHPSFCIMGVKFSPTPTQQFPTKHIWPQHLQEKARCMVCDKTTAPGACKKDEERKA